MRALVCFTALLFRLGAGVATATAEEYRVAQEAQDALDYLSRTRMLSQKCTKEFYFFLFDVDPDKNAQLVREDMELIKEGFMNFTLLIKGISSDFDAKLDKLNTTIHDYESAIAAFEDVFSFEVTTTQTSTTNTMATTTSTTTTTLLRMYLMWPVENGAQGMMDQMTVLWDQFTKYVLMMGIYDRLYAYDFVDRKRVLNQEIGKFAVLRSLGNMMPNGYSQDLSSHALGQLLSKMDAFTLGHYALLEGSAWLGNTMVPDVCLLYQTCKVTYQYEEKVLPELRRVIYRLRQTPEDWERLDREINQLLTEVEGNFWMIKVVEGKPCPTGGCGGRWNRAMECKWVKESIDNNMWLNAVSMLNRNRRVLQEVARIYLQIRKGFDVVNRIDRLKLRREEFVTTMNRIIQGYTVENVPSPPTQDLSQTLQDFMFKNWRPIDEIFRQALSNKATTFDGRIEGADNTTLILLDMRIALLEELFLDISNLYVRECPPGLRQMCFMVQASFTQATAYERMVKEAWFCSLFENSTEYLQRFNYTKDNLTAATLRLVDGVPVTQVTVQAEHDFWAMKIRRHIKGYGHDADTSTRKDEFVSGVYSMPGTTKAEKVYALRKAYVYDNNLQKKQAWMPPDTYQGLYHDAHRVNHAYYRTLLEDNGYGDVYMFDMYSNLLYSVMKKVDFGLNFEIATYVEGEGENRVEVAYRDTLLGQVLMKALEQPNKIFESYWGKYHPSGDTDSAFMCTGIDGAEDGTYVGVICIQLPPEKGQDLPRTESYCILNELYLVRKYEANLIGIVESVVYPKNWTNTEMSRFTDAYFGALAPKFKEVNAYYSQADPSCVASKWLEAASIEQWRAAMSTASWAPSILPEVLKQYLVAQKMQEFGVKSANVYARDLRAKIDATSLTLGNNWLRDLRVGTLDGRLPAAPSQLVADKDLAALDAWTAFVAKLAETYIEQNVIPLGNMVYEAMDDFRALMTAFTTYARRSAHSIDELQPDFLAKTGAPGVYIEQMAMECAMLSLWQGSPANLTISVRKFEDAISELQSDSRTTAERCRVQAISKLLESWDYVKPKFEKFGIKFTYSEKQIAEMMNATAGVAARAATMQTMYEEVHPTCVLNDSGGIRSLVGLVTILCGLLTTMSSLF